MHNTASGQSQLTLVHWHIALALTFEQKRVTIDTPQLNRLYTVRGPL